MSDIDSPIPFDLTPKAYGAVAIRELETPSAGPELWRITSITLRPSPNGVIPTLPNMVAPIEARLFVDARREAARVLGCDPQDVHVEKVK